MAYHIMQVSRRFKLFIDRLIICLLPRIFKKSSVSKSGICILDNNLVALIHIPS